MTHDGGPLGRSPARPLNSSIDDALFQVTAELADVVYLIRLEPDPQFEFVSESVEDVIGYSADEHYADPDLMRRVVDPADAHILSELMRIPEGEPESFSVRWRHRDGSVVPTHHHARKLRGDDGSLWVVGAVTELTEASRSRDAVIEARIEAGEMLRAVMDSMLDPHVVFSALRDDQGGIVDLVYVDANPVACAYLRIPREGLIGKRLFSLFSGESASLLMTWAAQALGRGAALSLDGVVMESAVTHRAQRYFDVRAVPLPGGQVSLTWRDVTEQRRVARQVADSERALRRTMDDSAIGMCLIDGDGRFLTVNEALCDFFGYPADVLITKTWQELTLEADLNTDLAQVERVLAGQIDSYRLTKRYVHADGRVLVGDLSVSGIRTEEGEFLHFVSQIVDITEQTQLREELERSHREYELLTQYSVDVILRVALDGTILWASSSSQEQLGWEPHELVGRRNMDLVHPDDLEWFREEAQRLAREGGDSSIQARFQTADGGYAWLDAVGREVPATDGRQAYRVVRLRNVDRLMEEQEQLTYEAHHDPMTGLLAGHEARRRVSRMAERCRQEGRGLAIAYCDLDGLKEINDTHGHAAGDEYIRAVCQRMTETLRDGDLVGRLGGDEFLVALPGIHGADEAADVMTKVSQAVAEPWRIGAFTVTPSLSIGVTVVQPGDTVDAAVDRADAAMYHGKRTAPGRVSIGRTRPEQ